MRLVVVSPTRRVRYRVRTADGSVCSNWITVEGTPTSAGVRIETSRRKSVWDLTSDERKELGQALHAVVTRDLMEMHTQWHANHTTSHNGRHFLEFHRAMIREVERRLRDRGLAKFVPLPYWDPETPIPSTLVRVSEHESLNRASFEPPVTLSGSYLSVSVKPDPMTVSAMTRVRDFLKDLRPGRTSAALMRFKSLDDLGMALERVNAKMHAEMGGAMSTKEAVLVPIYFPMHALWDDIAGAWESNRSEKLHPLSLPVPTTAPSTPPPSSGHTH